MCTMRIFFIFPRCIALSEYNTNNVRATTNRQEAITVLAGMIAKLFGNLPRGLKQVVDPFELASLDRCRD